VEELLARFWGNFLARVGGPLTFRLVMQPLMASALAISAGIQDARQGRPPYFWTILTEKRLRRELIREGWSSAARIFFLAIVIDVVYQLMVVRWIYPLETLMVAICLALVPYLLIRGPVNRLARTLTRYSTKLS
jgi:hypothetical protein